MTLSRSDISKARKRIAVELDKNPLYTVLADGKRWFCPYCLENAFNGWPSQRHEQVELVLKHFTEKCNAWQNYKGKIRNAHDLIRKKSLRELRTRAKKCLVKKKAWQFSDVGNRWYCPFCVSETKATIPKNRTMDEKTLGSIIKHIDQCYAYKKLKGKEKPVDFIRDIVTKGNKRKRLRNSIKKHLEGDVEVWNQRDQNGAWRCPFCMTIMDHIDISSPLSKRENAPRLVTEHLLGTCKSYSQTATPKMHGEKPKSSRKKKEREPAMESVDGLESAEDDIPIIRSRHTSKWGKDGRMVAEDHGMTLESLGMSGEVELIGDKDLSQRFGGDDSDVLPDWREDLDEQLSVAKKKGKTKKRRKRGGGSVRVPVFDGIGEDSNDNQEPNLEVFEEHEIPDIRGYEIATELYSGSDSNRDFVDFLRCGPLHVFALGSVSTKAGDARKIGARARELLRIHVKGTTDPGIILKQLNTDIFPDLGTKTFISLLVGTLDPRPGRVVIARAGLFAPVLVRPTSGQMMRLQDFEGMVIGIDHGPMFGPTISTTTLQLGPDDKFVAHTSGVFEVRNKMREPFGSQRFEMVVRNYGRYEAEYFIDKLREKIDLFCRTDVPNKDVGVVVIKKSRSEAPANYQWNR